MHPNPDTPLSIRSLHQRYKTGLSKPHEIVETALERANSNAGKNVYIAQNEAWSLSQVELLIGEQRAIESQPLWGIPVSLKDCFDLEGFATTCGSKFLGDSRTPAIADSAVAARLRNSGAIITGKTHLHQLAYGITGENRDFGDCLQPADPRLLTGGSTSGGAASVQEGSAMAAIGTDTGGSIRVPAALCGLAGYRASITMSTGNGTDLWRGGEHLAPSFDTIGWIYRDLADGPLLGAALFGLPEVAAPRMERLRVGLADTSFLYDCEQDVLETLEEWVTILKSRGARIEHFDTAMWGDAKEIFMPIQASEAAALHPEPRDGFEPVIAERLRWGASLPTEELASMRSRLTAFRLENEQKLRDFDLLLLPNTPIARLRAGIDHSGTRAMILRYTMPVSLLGRPAITLPSRRGAPQLVGRLGADAELLALSAELAEHTYTHA
jgi:Asp-tRNA(Asn)/Glu-tRNA(Gln) amidotransferase A subunit family amidase